MQDGEEHGSTQLFRKYLRIRTDHPNPDYETVKKFLEDYAEQNGFSCRIFQAAENRPVLIMSIEGTNPALPSILLNSHTDVATVGGQELQWTHDPFAAHKTDNGDIFARGAQDMKCVGIQYLEAMRELVEEGVKLVRTVHLSFQPDEQIGSDLGMKKWIVSDDFKSLNVGFEMDEGYGNPGEEMRVFYSERLIRWGWFVAKGTPGYGSEFIQNAAAPKIHKVMTKLLQFRDEEEAKLSGDPTLRLGDVCSVNISALEGSSPQLNSVPDEFRLGFDLRVTPNRKQEVDDMLVQLCTQYDVSIEWYQCENLRGTTCTDSSSVWWTAFSRALEDSRVPYRLEQFQGITDARFIRHTGIPCLGFSPMNHTQIRTLGPDEYLNEQTFLKGIQIYKSVITAVANVQ